mgnify:CR=1 FL=1
MRLGQATCLRYRPHNAVTCHPVKCVEVETTDPAEERAEPFYCTATALNLLHKREAGAGIEPATSGLARFVGLRFWFFTHLHVFEWLIYCTCCTAFEWLASQRNFCCP